MINTANFAALGGELRHTAGFVGVLTRLNG